MTYMSPSVDLMRKQRLHGEAILKPYEPLTFLERKRALARQQETPYVHDFPKVCNFLYLHLSYVAVLQFG